MWARAVHYACDMHKIQYTPALGMLSYEAMYGSMPDVSKCQPFGVECWLYVHSEQRKDKKSDARGEPGVCVGRATDQNISAWVVFLPDRSSGRSQLFFQTMSHLVSLAHFTRLRRVMLSLRF